MARPAASTPDTATYRNFMTQPLPFAPLREGDIPGVGAATIRKLATVKDMGQELFSIDTAAKVMGLFALFNRDENEFIAFLRDQCEVAEYLARKIAEALLDKTQDFCDDAAYVSDGGTLPDGTSRVANNFELNKLSTSRLNDKGGVVPGLRAKVSVVDSRVRRMLKALGGSGRGTLSTLQLLGLYMCMGEEVFKGYMDDQISGGNLDKICAVLEHKANGLCGERVKKGSPPPKTSTPAASTPTPAAAATTTAAAAATTTQSQPSPGPPMVPIAIGMVALLAYAYLKFFSGDGGELVVT